MKKLLCMAASATLLAACATQPAAPPPRPAPPSKPPVERPETSKRILQSEAEQLCLLQARKRDGVSLTSIRLTSTKKVDAGYLSTLQIGEVERTCIITHQGEVRDYR